MTDHNVTALPVPNEQEVHDLCMKFCEVLDMCGASPIVQLAALADAIATNCECIDDNKPELLLDYIYHRALGQFHVRYIKRATPKPDNVTRFPNRPEEPTE